jgi:hypothetical protein
MVAGEVEDRIEELCLTFEGLMPYLRQKWNESRAPRHDEEPESEPAAEETPTAAQEV